MALLASSGCASGASRAVAPELTRLRVTTLPIVDDAPLYLGIEKGFFAREGLDISTVPVDSGPEAVALLTSGGADIAFGNYVTDILASSQGVPLRVLADGYAAAPATFMLVVRAGSPIDTPARLAGRRIAVNAVRNITALLTLASLKPYGIGPSRVTLVPMPFADMADALRRGTVDAAWMTEPTLSEAAQASGVTELLDTAQGATAGMPIAGYASTQRFAATEPRTVAAFQRAMRACAQAAADRHDVEQVARRYLPGVTPQTTAIMRLGAFPTTLSRARLQRVADVMAEFGVLSKPFDVTPLLR